MRGDSPRSSRRTPIRDLWLEYRVTRQVSTGNGGQWVAAVDRPGWFFWRELGYGVGHGPSISETQAQLAAGERVRAAPQRLADLAAAEAAIASRTSERTRKRRRSAATRGRRLREAIRAAGGAIPGASLH